MPTARVQTRATSTKLHTLCSLLSLLLLASTAAASSSSRSTNFFKRLRGSQIAPGVSPAGDDYWCRVEGECLPCPPGARNSDVCKIYGNRRPLICVPRHTNTGHSGPAAPVSDAFDTADTDADSDVDSSEGDENDKSKNTDDSAPPKTKTKPKPKPLVEPAGSQAEADDLARQDTETFRNAAAAAAGGGGGRADEKEEEEEGGGSKVGLSKADQELQDELQAERRRRQRRRGLVAESSSLVARRQGPISTWEACPKVLLSEHHDYFEFILCNAGFAAVAIAVLVFRQRTLALQQFARLAARIMQTQAV